MAKGDFQISFILDGEEVWRIKGVEIEPEGDRSEIPDPVRSDGTIILPSGGSMSLMSAWDYAKKIQELVAEGLTERGETNALMSIEDPKTRPP